MSDANKYTVGWISAISIEHVAAQTFFDEKHAAPAWIHENDDNQYVLGRMGKHNVVMAILPKGTTGVTSAALAAKDMTLTFPNVRVTLMVGIGGGVPSDRHDIRLGDVVVSVPGYGPSGVTGGVVQYDYAQTILKKKFQNARYMDQPPRALMTAVHALQSDYVAESNGILDTVNKILDEKPRLRRAGYGWPGPKADVLYRSNFRHRGDDRTKCEDVCGIDDRATVSRPERGRDEDASTVHLGLIASADTFMEDAEMRDLLSREIDVLCFEMEAAGLMNQFPCVIIRGISDYGDSHWNHMWRGYAAMAAAAYARSLINMVIPNRLESEKGIGQTMNQS